MINKNKLHVLSLFSGCGGLDLGLEGGFPDIVTGEELQQTGLRTIFANDIRPSAKLAWETYFNRQGIYHLGSIVDLVKAAQDGELILPSADIVSGGFPCQDFSVAGKRKGFNSKVSHHGQKLNENAPSIENRGQLYIWMKEVIKIVKPKFFIAENVKGLTNIDEVFTVIKKDFSELGYQVFTKVVNAKHYGVAQNRERVFFLGFNETEMKAEILNPYPMETNSNDNLITNRMILSGIPEPCGATDPSQKAYSKAKYYGAKVQGQTEINWNGVAPTIRSEHHGNIEFRRLSKEHGGVILDGPERRLTVRECARIQSFPDEYKFVQPGISGSEAYKLIGNAVPPRLAYAFGLHISKNWEDWFK